MRYQSAVASRREVSFARQLFRISFFMVTMEQNFPEPLPECLRRKIPLNPTPGSRWDASPKSVEREFVRRLRAAGISTTVRDTRGREIDGACGQLAAAEVDA